MKGINFCVEHGEVFGILGINGAGKTTILECIEGFRKYHSGNIKISGNIGIQLQSASLPAYMKVSEVILVCSRNGNVQRLNKSLLMALGVTDLQKKLYTELSAGQKKKITFSSCSYWKARHLISRRTDNGT